ncbi:MAG: type IV pilus modification protein PilV [Gammaproteobacteria bacterium]|nr:type IV pilus modification protein PilV [Gammaproteobacteria bacterium]
MMRKYSRKDAKGILTSLTPCRTSRGFTIIEVLVSIVIFSIGLIGIARLQVVSKQSNYDAVQRVAATSIAEEIIAKMRANPTQLAAYSGNGGGTVLGRSSISSVPSPACDSSLTTCNNEQLFEYDLWEIEQALDGATERDAKGNYVGGLVSPTACIDGPAVGGAGYYTIAIAWRGKVALSNPTLDSCGEDTGLYGDSNEYRRQIFFRVYIA